MKGPGLRFRYDVLRLWRCPKTNKLLKSPVNVTTMISPFTQEKTMMKLVESKRLAVVNIPVEEMYSTEFIEPFPPTENKVKSLPSGKRYLVPRENSITPDVTKDEQNTAPEIDQHKPKKNDKTENDDLDFDNGIF